MTDTQRTRRILEALLMAASEPLNVEQLQAAFDSAEQPDAAGVREALAALEEDYADSAVELTRVASGYRFQVRQQWSPWVNRLLADKPGRYSRALLETLALIAYRQPITRSEIEDIRGVSVSTNIMRSLQDRGWIRSVGQRDVPGRPTLYGTTRGFLDYFGLKSLDELPSLAELRDFDSLNAELDFGDDEAPPAAVSPELSTVDSEADQGDQVDDESSAQS